MLLLTAAPDVQEWAHLTAQLEDAISSDTIRGWLDDACYIESYKLVRQGPGEDHERVTHWTTNQDGYSREELAERMHEELDSYGVEVGEVIGSGNFSVVFDCPWDYDKVIKIGHGGMSDIGDIYGDGWLEYALYCMKRSREGMVNPLLPVIHKLYVSENEDWFVALLEKYAGTADSGHFTDDMKRKARTARHFISRGGYSMPASPCEEYKVYAKQLADDPLFPRCSDIHDGNIMCSEDGRVIITDPSSGNTLPHVEIARLLRQIGVLMPDPIADAEAESRMKRKRHKEVHQDNRMRMCVKNRDLPRLVVDNNAVVRFDDLPAHAAIAMEAMAKMIDSKPIWNMNGVREDNMRQFHRWIAIDPAKPISIRKIA